MSALGENEEGLVSMAMESGLLGLLERSDEVGESAVVHSPSALSRGDGERDGQVTLADPG